MRMDHVEISEIKNLASLEKAIQKKQKFLVIDGEIKLTKTQKNYTQALLLRDLALERKVLNEIESSIGLEEILKEYRQYEKDFQSSKNKRLRNSPKNTHLSKQISNTSKPLNNQNEAKVDAEAKAEAEAEAEAEAKTEAKAVAGTVETSINIQLPNHCAMNILCGTGALTSGSNIFMFHHTESKTPDVSKKSECSLHKESFGFEFIDVWDNIFSQSILPCLKKVFDIPSQLNFKMNLFADLDRTIYLASIFHEIGHQVGPWKVSPSKDKSNQMNGFELDVLGELSTDSLLITRLKDFPELAEFIILQRLFWFGRRGFKENALSGRSNEDNDSWIGIYLWEKLKQHKIFFFKEGAIHYDDSQVQGCFSAILKEIDDLYFESLKQRKSQKEIVSDWMKKSVPQKNGNFIYPRDLQQVLVQCQEIVEEPLFIPTFSFTQISELQKAAGGSL